MVFLVNKNTLSEGKRCVQWMLVQGLITLEVQCEAAWKPNRSMENLESDHETLMGLSPIYAGGTRFVPHGMAPPCEELAECPMMQVWLYGP